MDKQEFKEALLSDNLEMVCKAVFTGSYNIDNDYFEALICKYIKSNTPNAKNLALCLQDFPIFNALAPIDAFNPIKVIQELYIKDFFNFDDIKKNEDSTLFIALEKVFDEDYINPALALSVMSIGRYLEELEPEWFRSLSIDDVKAIATTLDKRVDIAYDSDNLNEHTLVFVGLAKGEFASVEKCFLVYAEAALSQSCGIDFISTYDDILAKDELNSIKLERIIYEKKLDKLAETYTEQDLEFVIDLEYVSPEDLEISKDPNAFRKQMYKMNAAERDLEKLWAKENDALYEPEEKPKRKVSMGM